MKKIHLTMVLFFGLALMAMAADNPQNSNVHIYKSAIPMSMYLYCDASLKQSCEPNQKAILSSDGLTATTAVPLEHEIITKIRSKRFVSAASPAAQVENGDGVQDPWVFSWIGTIVVKAYGCPIIDGSCTLQEVPVVNNSVTVPAEFGDPVRICLEGANGNQVLSNITSLAGASVYNFTFQAQGTSLLPACNAIFKGKMCCTLGLNP